MIIVALAIVFLRRRKNGRTGVAEGRLIRVTATAIGAGRQWLDAGAGSGQWVDVDEPGRQGAKWFVRIAHRGTLARNGSLIDTDQRHGPGCVVLRSIRDALAPFRYKRNATRHSVLVSIKMADYYHKEWD